MTSPVCSPSSTDPPCLVFVDREPRSGADNMELDRLLLERVTRDPSCSLIRVYRWTEPTVTTGYFQRHDSPAPDSFSKCPVVPRLTGGGAILHDQEVTYSCAMPGNHSVRADPTRLYEIIHLSIIRLLGELNVQCSMRGEIPCQSESERMDQPFLCFLRQDPRDIVMDGHKITGSAQRRRRGSILQHGSILLQASKLTPEIPGITNLRPNFNEAEFCRRLPDCLGAAVASTWILKELTPQDDQSNLSLPPQVGAENQYI